MKNNLRFSNRWLWLIILLPPLALAILLLKFSVNVPFWDQWELVPIFRNVRNGHFYLNDFWQLHNEHRLLFPRLVMIGAAVITGWNIRVEILINFLLALGSFGLLISLYFKNKPKLTPFTSLFTAFMFSAIWFSPLQGENWLWGWQIQWFLSVLGIMMVLYALADTITDTLSWVKVIFMIAGGVIAQFSLGNGIIIWPLAIVALLYKRTELKKVAVVAGTAIFTTGLSFMSYHAPAGTPSRTEVLSHPIAFIKYVLIYIGRPLSSLGKLTPLIGLLILSLFVLLTVWLFVRYRKRFDACLPWIVLGCYGILSAIVTASSRINLGTAQAYSARYTTISSLVLVGIIAIVVFNLDIIKQLMSCLFRPVMIGAAAVLVLGVGTNALWGIHKMRFQYGYLSDIRNCTRADAPYEVCLLSAYPDQHRVKERLDYLKQIRWGGY
jgi:hypothetical protein